jgi:hypothetical protein
MNSVLAVNGKILKSGSAIFIAPNLASGEYNITSTDNDDGTQNLVITDAENNND